jgi:tRNA(Ile)-lysidine synthase
MQLGAPAPRVDQLGAAAPLAGEEFAALMAPLGPFGPAPTLAAGVSGGPHSLALAVLAQRWARARGGDLLALILDHGLRAESAAEAAHVAAQLASLGIPAEVTTLALPPGPALQERAREARLEALLAACARHGRPWLLLGHHLLDQAETLLFRALRGSGADGLAAMAPLRSRPDAALLRPLLSVPPARLEALLAMAGIVPVRDPSNLNPRFARIRLRQALGDPGGEGREVAALAEAADAFATRAARREAALALRLSQAVTLHPEGHAEICPDGLGSDSIADLALARLVRVVSGSRHAPARAAIAALRLRGHGTLAGADLQGGRRWRLRREVAAMAGPVPARQGAVWDGRFRLLGPGLPGHSIAGLGPPPAEVRRAGRHLPPGILPTLPAIFCDGSLVVVPGLLYPVREACAPFRLAFAPAGGSATGQGPSMPAYF